MTRQLFILYSDDMRRRVCEIIGKSEKETRVTIQAPKRTLSQNAKLHAMIVDVSVQHQHAERHLTVREWKILFCHELDGELKMLPSIDRQTFVPIGRSTSDLSIAECSALIEVVYKRGAEWGIVWSEPELWHKDSGAGAPPPAPERPQVLSLPAEAGSAPTSDPASRRRLTAEEAIALLPISRTIRSAVLKDGTPITSEWALEEVTHDLRHAKTIALSDKCEGFPLGMQDRNSRVVYFETRKL